MTDILNTNEHSDGGGGGSELSVDSIPLAHGNSGGSGGHGAGSGVDTLPADNVMDFNTAAQKTRRMSSKKGGGGSGGGGGAGGSGGGGSGSGGGHAGAGRKKAVDPKTTVLSHRIAAALAGRSAVVSGAYEPLPLPEITFGHLIDERGATLPIEIQPNGEVRDIASVVILKAAAEYLQRRDLVDIIDKETSGLGSLVRDFKPAYLKEILEIWERGYAKTHRIEDIAMVKERSKAGMAFKVLDYDFIDHAFDSTPWFDEILGRFSGEESAKAFMAFVGSLFFDDADRSQYVYLYGEGENSKGKIIEAIIHLMGRVAAPGAEPKKGSDLRFWAFANLYLKRVVAFGDLGDPRFVTSAEFKGFTGDDYTQVEGKNMNAFKAKICAKFLIASNNKPHITNDKADLRRALFFKIEPFRGVSLNDAELVRVWEREGPGFFAKCVEEYMVQCPNHERIKCAVDELTELADDNEAILVDIIDRFLVPHSKLGFKIGDLKRLLIQEGVGSGSQGVDHFLRVFERSTGIPVVRRDMRKTFEGPTRASWGFGIKRTALEGRPAELIAQATLKEEADLIEIMKSMGADSQF